MSRFITPTLVTSAILASAVLGGCSEAKDPAMQAATAPEVNVANVVSMRLSEWDEFSGRLQAPESVTLIPRISGYVEQILFEEGALVKAGDVLVKIDPRPFEVDVERLQAQLDSAESHMNLTESLFQRGESLVSKNAISQEALDNRRAEWLEAKAQTAAIRAELKQAELSLSYTEVVAPVSGRVSNASITKGNYVSAGSSELTRIVSTEKMYAWFSVDEQTYLQYARNGLINNPKTAAQTVSMGLSGDEDFRYHGAIEFVDNRIDAQTGSIRIRATFRNEDGSLMPGMYSKIRLAGSDVHDGILIDEKAIGTDLNNKFVLVVDSNNTVTYRKIDLGESLGDLRIVENGLSEGESIIVNGLQRVMPGMQITPATVDMADESPLAAIRTSQQQLEPESLALNVSVNGVVVE